MQRQSAYRMERVDALVAEELLNGNTDRRAASPQADQDVGSEAWGFKSSMIPIISPHFYI